MGLDAQVIAIGSFSKGVISALEYEAERYVGVEPGQTVITNVFVVPRPSSISHELARAFGVEAMELGKHHLNPQTADVRWLESVFGEQDTANFMLLREHKFNFYYLPNG